MAKKVKRNLEMMREVTRRNNDREREHVERSWLEAHMRERLAEIRTMIVPPAIEPVRQEIIERYEHDLATWVY